MQFYRVKYLKCLRKTKYNLEHKCERNLSLVWLLLATVTIYLNCHLISEWTLHTHSEHWKHYQSVVPSLAVGQIEQLPWVQNGPVGFEKKHAIRKMHYMCRIMNYFVSVGLQWTNRKIGKIVTLHQRQLFKKIPRLSKFCSLSVNEGLKVSTLLHNCYCCSVHYWIYILFTHQQMHFLLNLKKIKFTWKYS